LRHTTWSFFLRHTTWLFPSHFVCLKCITWSLQWRVTFGHKYYRRVLVWPKSVSPQFSNSRSGLDVGRQDQTPSDWFQNYFFPYKIFFDAWNSSNQYLKIQSLTQRKHTAHTLQNSLD
jgi:hypothetical protein